MPRIQQNLPAGNERVLYWGFMLVPAMVLCDVRSSALIGMGSVLSGQLSENVIRPGVLLALTALIYLAYPSFYTAKAGMAATAVAALVSLVVLEYIQRSKTPKISKNQRVEYDARVWSGALWPLGMTAGVHLINRNTDILMLGLFHSSDDVGVYRVAAHGAMLVPFGLTIVNVVFAPRFARLFASGKTPELQRATPHSAQISFAFALPVALTFLFFGRPILSHLIGASYSEGAAALSILSLGQLMNVGMASVAILLNMTGHERDTAKGVAVGAATNVALNLVLIPPYGMVRAAIASAAALAVLNVILYTSVTKRLRVHATFLFPFRAKGTQ